MTKRMIDADALMKCVQSLSHGMYCEDMMRDYTVVVADDLIKKINELATPANEPQERIFDAHVFNLKEESRHSQYWRPNDILISNQDTIIKLSADNFNCHKLRKLRNITAEQRCLYSKICELADRLDKKIQQESIFDADGWCYDLKAIPKNELIDLAVLCVKDKSINREVNYILNDDNDFYSSDYEHYLDDSYEFGYVIVAWRPLPTTPKEA